MFGGEPSVGNGGEILPDFALTPENAPQVKQENVRRFGAVVAQNNDIRVGVQHGQFFAAPLQEKRIAKDELQIGQFRSNDALTVPDCQNHHSKSFSKA